MTNGTTPRLTPAQVETIEDLASHGYREGFLLHEVFTERDNQANGARRCLRRLIARSLIVKTEWVDGRGNPFYRITMAALNGVVAYRKREWDAEVKRVRKRLTGEEG